MDLKIKDVAEFLSLSEAAVQQLALTGKIPSYRINDQYLFSRIEIEDWMMRSDLNSQEVTDAHEIHMHSCADSYPSSKGMQQFCLYRALHQGDVFSSIAVSNKEEMIRIVTQEVAPKLGVDGEVLSELLIDREKLMPTALGCGIAVPHTRDFLRKGPLDMVFVVYPEEPIEYGSLDGAKVHTLFFLFASNDKGHLQLLAKLAHLGSNAEALKFLQNKPSKKELLEFIRNWEGSLRYACVS